MTRREQILLAVALILAIGSKLYGQVPTASMCETCIGRSAGSGVVVGHKDTATYVLTCRHILDGAGGQASVKFSNGQRLAAQLQRPQGFPDDLLMFVTSRVQIDPVPIAEEISGGESVWKAGFPATQFGTSPLNIQKGRWRGSGRFDCYVWSGDSGGGVFNSKGELLGIISGYDTQTSLCSSLSSTKRFVSHWSQIFTQSYCYPGGYCQPSYGYSAPISYGGAPRPQYPAPSQPAQPPAPKPQQPTPATPPSSGQCSCEGLAELKASILKIQKSNEETRRVLVELQNAPGVPGPKGRDGQRGADGIQGPPGRDGKDGAPGKDGKDAPPLDQKAIVAQVVAELRALPIRMKQRDPYTGEITSDVLVRLGDSVTFDTTVKE